MACADRSGAAGFYSDSRFWDRCVEWYYRCLSHEQRADTPVGYQVQDSERIVTSLQSPRAGDVISDGPPGTAYYVMRYLEPNKAFMLFTDTHVRYLLRHASATIPRLGVVGELATATFC